MSKEKGEGVLLLDGEEVMVSCEKRSVDGVEFITATTQDSMASITIRERNGEFTIEMEGVGQAFAVAQSLGYFYRIIGDAEKVLIDGRCLDEMMDQDFSKKH
ncbi:TPA: hypothetical protein L3821_005957 [Pseudomonas aeruginosa]|nr:hypothetical protein [Pseudomonas aeruginosa]